MAVMMKPRLVLLLLLGVACTVSAQDDNGRLLNMVDGILSTAEERLTRNPTGDFPTFTIINNTGFTIRTIYVCRSGSESWGSNVLNFPLYNGQNVSINMSQPLDGSTFNIRLIDVDGDLYSKYDVALKSRSVIRMGISDFEF